MNMKRMLLKLLRHPWSVRLAQLATGGIFIAAAMPKIGDVAAFAGDIHNYRLMPLALENLLAVTLPWIELVLGVALIVNIQARAAAWLATGLMVVFMIAIGQAVARDLSIECGCFGKAGGRTTGYVALLTDAGFLVLALIASFRPIAPRR